ncbi:TIGR02680 family protein [Micromonospora sp. NPDC000207]|uniref:TIGR02680 family protein n=1 Tax=Micromonospora sp. NPDC000207 TaxID=3154246 RepID=UPI00332235B3
MGCVLLGGAGRVLARIWFLVTSQGVGGDLALVGPTGTALARERLREALGVEGRLYDRAVDYRRAVDEALFGLGSRYDALISLLIRLRQPQLSKRPDEKSLSRALGDALTPLNENLITQVAEAFRSLDDERETLRDLADTHRAADEFLTRYRQYARVATRRRAAVLRQQHNRYEQLSRDLTEAQRAYDEADAELAAAQKRIEELTRRSRELDTRWQALRESPEARTAEHLGRLRELAEQRARLARQQEQRLTQLRADVARTQRVAEEAARDLERAGQNQETARDRVRRDTDAARLTDGHTRRVLPALDRGVAAATAAAEELIASRTTALRTLDRLRDAADRAREVADRARADVDRFDGELAAADLRVEAVESAVTEAGELLVRQTGKHLTGLVELRVDDPEAVLAALELWADGLVGENPARRETAHAARTATEALTRADAAAETEQRTARRELDRIEADLRELGQGRHRPPPAPYTRADGVRTDRPGAPLWRVVDFVPEVPPEQRPGIEAALEAAGILDAWVDPEGALRDPVTGDTLLRPGPPVSAHLGGLLRPAIDRVDGSGATPTEETVTAVLTAIGLGPGSAAATWVDTDGSFGNGILTGRWTKTAAEHIGEGAREAYRRMRGAQLRREADELTAELAAVTTRREELRRRREQVTAEVEALPSEQPLREAHTLVRGAHQHRRDIVTGRAEADGRLRQRLTDAEAALTEATEFAGDVDLPYDPEEVAEVRDGLQSYRVALAAWWPTLTGLRTATARREEADREHAQWLERLTPAAVEAEEARSAATTARIEFETLDATAGDSVAELHRRIAEVAEERQRCGRDSERARDQERSARDARGDAQGQRTRLRETLDEVTRARDQAVEGLRAFAGTGLVGLACPDLEVPAVTEPWAATPAVTLARAAERSLADTEDDDRRWDRLQQQVSTDMKTLTDSLSRHGHQVLPMVREETMVVEVIFQGHPRTVADLAAALVDEIAERQRVLSAHEREVLETHLVNEVAGALQELIVGAERQVDEMNAELQTRPTSTGMRLRLLWRPTRDAPAGLAELRGRQLRQSTDVWNDEDRRMVGAFLQEQIDRERLRDDAATWTEQLTRALDYRAWHEFVIQRYQDGQWRPAAGPASGGERVLAASIPLFAAASSYYGSAGNPHAPRLIALDEAFAGVDDDSRAKCLGLLATFDLDVVMTSEREWGCYPQVPGLGIAQLSRHDGIDAVLVTPWRWDGRQRRQTLRPEQRTPKPRGPEPAEGGGPSGTSESGDGQPALWGPGE